METDLDQLKISTDKNTKRLNQIQSTYLLVESKYVSEDNAI